MQMNSERSKKEWNDQKQPTVYSFLLIVSFVVFKRLPVFHNSVVNILVLCNY